MKSFFAFLLLFISFTALATEGKKGIGSSYLVAKQAKDSKVPAGKSKIVFTSWTGSSKTAGNQQIHYSIDGKNETATTDGSGSFSLTTKAGKHVFLLQLNSDYYEIRTDSIAFKSGYRTNISLFFAKYVRNVTIEKPVIYLYPEAEQAVSIQLEPAGVLQFTYPVYENGWNVTVDAAGTITQNSQRYPYLFWEAKTDPESIYANVQEGFVVDRENVVAFLEEHLAAIGLNSTEQTDFITYWGPRLSSGEQVFVQFVWNEAADRFGKLQIAPQPDHVNRLYIVWSALNEPLPKLPMAQELPIFDRSGFDVLEWGGSEIPAASLLSLTSSAVK